ncbi:MAG: hypothetical protein UT32_C0009G0045 [Parcubacteria group bacterium GW2011_GWC2_39_14]|nr:MAG: hypothetical protein UT32_C0009G0045 [Parcubacteria group bacterium GW2011_GWC2_39_14]
MTKTIFMNRAFVSIIAVVTVFTMSGIAGLIQPANAANPPLDPPLTTALVYSNLVEPTNLTVGVDGSVLIADFDLQGNDQPLSSFMVYVEPVGDFDPATDLGAEGLASFTLGIVESPQGPDDVLLSFIGNTPMVGSGFFTGMYAYQLTPTGSDPLISSTLTTYYLNAVYTDTAVVGHSFVVKITSLSVASGESAAVFTNVVGGDPALLTTETMTFVEGEEPPPGGDGFSLVAYGPMQQMTIPKYAPVDFFFNEDLNSAVRADLDSYFQTDPVVAGNWNLYDEYWGENHIYHVGFFPADGWETGTSYNVKAAKSITNTEDEAFSLDLGGGDGFEYGDMASDELFYYFTVVGSDQEDSGYFPPMAFLGYPNNEMHNVPTSLQQIGVEFDRNDMDATTFTNENIYLVKVSPGGGEETVDDVELSPASGLSGSVSLSGFTLEANTKYRVYVTRDVMDSRGNRLAGQFSQGSEPGPFTSSFYTGGGSDQLIARYMGTNLNFFRNGAGQIASSLTGNITIEPSLGCGEGGDLSLSYDANSFEAIVIPNCLFTASTSYTLSFEDLMSVTGTEVNAGSLVFTTGLADAAQPTINSVMADNYGLIIEFNEPMDTTLAENKGNYALKVRNDATDWAEVTATPLSNAVVRYESDNKTVFIDISLTAGSEYQVTVSSNLTDLSDNPLLTDGGVNVRTGYVMDASKFAGGQGNQGMGGSTFDMGNMGEMPIAVRPMSKLVGVTTKYFVDLPISQQINAGGKIEFWFPQGFITSAAIRDAQSPVNGDFNQPAPGKPSFANTDPAGTTSNGVANDGIGIIGERTIVIKLSEGTMPQDFLRIDLDGIVNSSTVKKEDTAGWQVSIMTYNSSGVMLEGLTSMPFYTSAGGTNSLTVDIDGVSDGDDGSLGVYLFSPMTGQIMQTATITGDESEGVADGSVTFNNLDDGQYEFFTDKNAQLDGNMYYGNSFMDSISLSGGEDETREIIFSDPATQDNLYALEVTLIGDFTTDGENDNVDIFAGSPNGFRVITASPGNTAGYPVTLYLPDGEWNVGMGPAMSATSTMASQIDWMPPQNQFVKVWNNGWNASVQEVILDSSNIEQYSISGSVVDENDVGIADVEVYAYQPQASFGKQSVKTQSDGSFVLNVGWPGVYTLGTNKNGFPESSQQSIAVNDDVSDVSFVLKKPAFTISGMVKDYNGNGVPNAPVWSYQTAGGFGWSGTSTDVTGSFILYVDTGTWMVESDPKSVGWMQYSDAIEITDESVSGITLQPDTDLDYVTITGNVSIDGNAYTYGPIRAVKYNANGSFAGQQYGGQTDSQGDYSITVPEGIYRVDIWAPGYGEIERTDSDDYPNNPANVNATSGNVDGVDITVGADDLIDVSVNFTNLDSGEYDGVSAFVTLSAVNLGTGIPTGYKNNIMIKNIADPTFDNIVKVKEGNYFAFVQVPGYGEFIPLEGQLNAATTPGYIDVGAGSTDSNTLTIDLPDVDNLITVTGSVIDAEESPVENAWVTINNMEKGFNRGVNTDSSGEFSINLPVLQSGNYNIAVGKPGYMAVTPEAVDLTDVNLNGIADALYEFTLQQQTALITGNIFADKDGGTNNVLDVGEGLAYGWIFAQETITGLVSNTPVDGKGYYQLGVVNGTWEVFGNADGYEQTQYKSGGVPATIVVNNGNQTNKNIELGLRADWNKKTKKSPMTLNQGGTIDDSASTGTGVKLVVPANAMGTSSSSGSFNISNTTSVGSSNTSRPFGMEGKVVSAVDADGQPITTLSDYIDIEMVVWKSEVDAEIAAERMTEMSDLLSAQLGYYDNSTDNWVALETTRVAYYQENEDDAEWKTYISDDETLNDYEAFITDALIDETFTAYFDYKLVFTAKTNHLTTFGVTTALGVAGGEESANDAPRSTSGAGSAVILVTETIVDKAITVPLSTSSSTVVLSKAGTMNFTSSGLAHSLTLKNVDVTGQSAILVVASTPFEVTAKLNKAELVDINKDGVNDMEVLLTAINSANDVKLTVKLLVGASIVPPGAVVTPTPVAETPATTAVTTEYMPRKAAVINLMSEQQALTDFIALTKLVPNTQADNWVVDYLAYGNSTRTLAMSARERKGILEDFISIYGNLPKTESDWKALAEIAAGKVTPKRVIAQEVKAIKEFFKIFKKTVNFKDKTNESFVHKLSYRMRVDQRNLAKEQTALTKFIKVYQKKPWDGYAWSIVRALAYSGILDK